MKHLCQGDGYFGECPACDEEERKAKDEAKKWENQKFFCNACGKKCLISNKYGGFSGWRTCSKKCHEEIEMRCVANNIRQDYEPWTHEMKTKCQFCQGEGGRTGGHHDAAFYACIYCEGSGKKKWDKCRNCDKFGEIGSVFLGTAAKCPICKGEKRIPFKEEKK